MKDKISEKLKGIRAKYFFYPVLERRLREDLLAVRLSGNALMAIQEKAGSEGIRMVFLDRETLEVQGEPVRFDKPVRVLRYLEKEGKILYNFLNPETRLSEPYLRMMDLETRRSEIFNRDREEKIWLMDMKGDGEHIYIVDSCTHRILIYDTGGELKNTIELKGICEFPRFIEVVPGEEKVVINTADRDSEKQNVVNLDFKKHSTIPLSRYNLYLLDLKTAKVIRRQKISASFHWFSSLTRDRKGDLYLMGPDCLYKITPQLQLLWEANLHRILYGYPSPSRFVEVQCDGDFLFFLEKNQNAIYKVQVVEQQ